MEKVKFETDTQFPNYQNRPIKHSFLVQTTINLGLAQDENTANKVLLAVAVVLIVLAGFLFIRRGGSQSDVVIPPTPYSQGR